MNETSFPRAVTPARSGLADWLAAMHAAVRPLLAHVRETVTARSSAAALAVVGFAVAPGGLLAESSCIPTGDPAPRALVAEFTGRFDRGAPIYRLPSITVSATRNQTMIEARTPKRQTRDERAAQGPNNRTPSS